MSSAEERFALLLDAVLTLSAPTLHVGEDGTGLVQLHNKGPTIVEFETEQPIVGELLDSTSGKAVGFYSGFIAGVGKTCRLLPNADVALSVLFGTVGKRNRRRPGVDDAGISRSPVAPGRYVVRVLVPRLEFNPDLGLERKTAAVAVAPITVTT